jgi:hypothetical protein
MEAQLLSCLIAVTFFAARSELSTTAFAAYTQAQPAADSSLMKPTDIAYSDALAFAALLREQGFEVTSIHRSKLGGLFEGVDKAAFFRMGKRAIDVIFLSGDEAARRIQVDLKRDAGRYIYTFRGLPGPGGGGMDSQYPIYFVTHRKAFIFTDDRQLAERLKTRLAGLDK